MKRCSLDLSKKNQIQADIYKAGLGDFSFLKFSCSVCSQRQNKFNALQLQSEFWKLTLKLKILCCETAKNSFQAL